MLSYDLLINDLSLSKIEPKKFLENFFTKENFKEYHIASNPDKYELKAIKNMFESKKDLLERVESSIKHDPFCLEAFFVYFVLSEDVYVNYRFEAFHDEMKEFGSFTDHQKHNYLKIMELYVEFLSDIHNYSRAIKIQKMICILKNNSDINDIYRLAYLYYEIEDADDFYRFYLDSEFNETSYLLLIITLLKKDEKLKAKEVLLEMLKKYEYAKYLDHLWDLDLDDPKQKKFYKDVESIYLELSSIPDFFVWVNEIKENNMVV